MHILQALGLRPAVFARVQEALAKGLIVARIVEVQRKLYLLEGELQSQPQQWWAEVSGRIRHESQSAAELPTVGDWVIASSGGPHDRLQILGMLPRHSMVGRKSAGRREEMQLLAANVDHIFIVSSCNQDWSLRRLERYRLLAEQAGVAATLLVSKLDLAENREALNLDSARRIFPLILLSLVTGEGLDELSLLLKPMETVMFIGSSGVGKSSLINALMGGERQSTQAIRNDDGKGRHTTSSRSLFSLPNGCLVMDMPGIRELGLIDLDEVNLDAGFQDIAGLAQSCRFRDCSHEQEPACAVQMAIAEGRLDRDRYRSYRKLLREQEASEARQDPQKMSERKKKWKAIAKQLRQRPRKERW